MPKLTRDELIERVQKIIDLQGTDDELESLADEINENIPHPDITDLIYDDEQILSSAAIVDKALSYRPRSIQLPASAPEADEK